MEGRDCWSAESGNHETMIAKTNPTSSFPDSGTGGAGRRFSKAKSIAERLGVCPRTIFRWADDGKITRHKINARVVLFDESEVLALIVSSRVHAG